LSLVKKIIGVKELVMKVKSRQLEDLISVGPAMLRDFDLLGVRSVAELSRRDPDRLYRDLGRIARQHQDICVLDVFRAAVAQARNPRLPGEQCQWWWWSSKRKAHDEEEMTQRRKGRRGIAEENGSHIIRPARRRRES
jgi:nucleotidyltransferase/DNA polymerase involved in DNA repair